jgi:hypothetical protein
VLPLVVTYGYLGHFGHVIYDWRKKNSKDFYRYFDAKIDEMIEDNKIISKKGKVKSVKLQQILTGTQQNMSDIIIEFE